MFTLLFIIGGYLLIGALLSYGERDQWQQAYDETIVEYDLSESMEKVVKFIGAMIAIISAPILAISDIKFKIEIWRMERSIKKFLK